MAFAVTEKNRSQNIKVGCHIPCFTSGCTTCAFIAEGHGSVGAVQFTECSLRYACHDCAGDEKSGTGRTQRNYKMPGHVTVFLTVAADTVVGGEDTTAVSCLYNVECDPSGRRAQGMLVLCVGGLSLFSGEFWRTSRQTGALCNVLADISGAVWYRAHGKLEPTCPQDVVCLRVIDVFREPTEPVSFFFFFWRHNV